MLNIRSMKIIAKARQTLSDIAVEVYGDVRAVCVIAHENNMSVTDIPAVGSTLECPELTYDRYMQGYVAENGISPATEPEEDSVYGSKY